MSASLLVDLGQTCQLQYSFPSRQTQADQGILITSGGAISSLSGVLIGGTVDLLQSDTYCNLFAMGIGFGSGPLVIGVQTSPDTTSGNFTDPTSGQTAFLPTAFASGGVIIIGSGPTGASGFLGTFSSGYSGSIIGSGWMAAAAFLRPHRFARAYVASGFYDGTLMVGFISQLRTTGSGGGFAYAPTSGTVSV